MALHNLNKKLENYCCDVNSICQIEFNIDITFKIMLSLFYNQIKIAFSDLNINKIICVMIFKHKYNKNTKKKT